MGTRNGWNMTYNVVVVVVVVVIISGCAVVLLFLSYDCQPAINEQISGCIAVSSHRSNYVVILLIHYFISYDVIKYCILCVRPEIERGEEFESGGAKWYDSYFRPLLGRA